MRSPAIAAPDVATIDPKASALTNAACLSHFALAAYSDDVYGSLTAISRHFPSQARLDTHELQAFMAGNDTDAVIAIRGSSAEREWTKGLRFGHRREAFGSVHEGFAGLLDSIWERTLAALYDIHGAERRLWLAGHSAGGAMALIAGARLEHAGFEVDGVATFGSPPVIDEAMRARLRTPVYRVINAEDPVPHLSWPGLFREFVHVGEPIRLTRTGRIAADRHSDRLAYRMDRVHELFEGPARSGMRHDHTMREYVRKLNRAQG